MKKRIGIWIRVSTEDQVKGESPKHHEKRARMFAELKDWNVVELYNLEAVSGKSVIEHPETKRMLADIARGHIEALVFSKVARLARNTRELLEIADVFKKYDADLVSLQEAIDTSSPAGRLFFTMVAAMAQWEREEIAERVKVSVPVRAKLGKPLGGRAPYGYKMVGKTLEIDEEEAQVRKLMFELFAEHKRKRTVAKILNERGYRTRTGHYFIDSMINRCLREPIAKGLRRVNHSRNVGPNKPWVSKPKDEWIFQPVPPIVSEELWDTCNAILDKMTTKEKKIRRQAVHLFSGIVSCDCGTMMYMRSNSPAYVCANCKNKIKPDILEEIFQGELQRFIFSDKEINRHLSEEAQRMSEKKKLLIGHEKRIADLNKKIDQLFNLYYENKVDKDTFEKRHTPLNTELQQNQDSIAKIQATIDAMSMNALSNDQVIHDARDLQSYWKDFTPQDKRTIIEAITESIIVGKEDIHIKLNYLPTLANDKSQTPPKPKKQSTFTPVLFLPLKLLQLCGARMRVRFLRQPRAWPRVRTVPPLGPAWPVGRVRGRVSPLQTPWPLCSLRCQWR